MTEQVLGKKAEALPRPLGDYRLDLPTAAVGLRLELKIKSREMEDRLLHGESRGEKWTVPITTSKLVDKIEPLRGAHYLPSKDGTRLFLFASRDAVSDYVLAIREGRSGLQRAREDWMRDQAEAKTQMAKARSEVAALEAAIASAEAKFMDSVNNLSYAKAKGALTDAEMKIRNLKQRLLKPEPRPDTGSAIATQFGADEIVAIQDIIAAVDAERERLLDEFGALPRKGSEIRLGRHTILSVVWKHP